LMEVKVLGFSDQYFLCISHFLHVCCIFWNITLLDWVVLRPQIMKPHIRQIAAVPSYFITTDTKYFLAWW
jgi:hypothetical protein